MSASDFDAMRLRIKLRKAPRIDGVPSELINGVSMFGTESLDLLHKCDGSLEIRLPDGRLFQDNHSISMLGKNIGPQGTTMTRSPEEKWRR